MLEKIPGDNSNINYPLEISFNFIAPFLNNSPCSAGITIDNAEEKRIFLWRKDMVPIIFTSIGEKEFLKGKKLILIVMLGDKEKNTEIMIGKFLLIIYRLKTRNGFHFQNLKFWKKKN